MRRLLIISLFLVTPFAHADVPPTPPKIPSKVLIFDGSVGMGHTVAAESVMADLSRLSPGIQVEVMDLRKFMFPWTRKASQVLYDTFAQKLPYYFDDLFLRYLKKGETVKSVGDMPWVKDFRPKKVLSEIQKFNPDVILSTFPPASELLVHLRDQGYLRMTPMGYVLTDLTDELYFSRIALQMDMVFVGTKEMEKNWLKRGVPPDRVLGTGMPLNPNTFAKIPDAEIKAFISEQKLVEGIPTILISSGSQGVGNYPLMVNQISNEFGAKDIQIIAVCGDNKGHFKALTEMKKSLQPNVRLHITKKIKQPELFKYMQMSDVIIGKTGGLTPYELFYKNKPLILLDINGAHERYNANVFERFGLAHITNDQTEVGKVAASFIQDPKLANEMMLKQRQFCSEQCTQQVAEWILKAKAKPMLHETIKLDPSLIVFRPPNDKPFPGCFSYFLRL